MSLDAKVSDSPVITSVAQLEDSFRTAERPLTATSPGLIGLEHEKLLFTATGGPVPYEGPSGIGAVLEAFAAQGWAPYRETADAPIIAMTRGQTTVSLEPGGQVELSGAPFVTAREAHAENVAHLESLRGIASRLGLRVAALGYRPFDAPSTMPWMPKSRYRIMRTSLGERGSHALNMMLMTATGQVSLDWASEADCAKKVTASSRISPLLVALFANSPIVEGRASGFASFRSRVWNDVDPARCGYTPAMVDGSFSYRAYVEWVIDAPMLFVRRDGAYHDPKCTFRQLLARGYDGQPARMSDWVDHLSTMFPEVRIKRVLEIRAADCVSEALTGSLAALMRGLLYDAQALEAAMTLLPTRTLAQQLELQHAAQREGLRARVAGIDLGQRARELVDLAAGGLARLDAADLPLLAPLQEVAAAGRSPAEAVLKAFERDPSAAALVAAFPV